MSSTAHDWHCLEVGRVWRLENGDAHATLTKRGEKSWRIEVRKGQGAIYANEYGARGYAADQGARDIGFKKPFAHSFGRPHANGPFAGQAPTAPGAGAAPPEPAAAPRRPAGGRRP